MKRLLKHSLSYEKASETQSPVWKCFWNQSSVWKRFWNTVSRIKMFLKPVCHMKMFLKHSLAYENVSKTESLEWKARLLKVKHCLLYKNVSDTQSSWVKMFLKHSHSIEWKCFWNTASCIKQFLKHSLTISCRSIR